MFTNLIESNSHVREFRRRSSFFLVTVAAYALILFAAGVAGVLTYDARVEAQTSDLTLLDWVPPVKPVTPDGPQPTHRPTKTRAASNAPVDPHINTPERIERIPPVDDLRVTPPAIGTTAPSSPPVEGPVNLTGRNADPPSAANERDGCATCPTPTTTPAVENRTPPVAETPRPTTLRVSAPVILAKALDLPKPAYPAIARQARIQGPVNVQVLIDESGRVISAQAVKGSAMLTKAAEDAARRARFTPTKLGDQAVKVQGVIIYNFVLHQ
jgi:protein TonB